MQILLISKLIFVVCVWNSSTELLLILNDQRINPASVEYIVEIKKWPLIVLVEYHELCKATCETKAPTQTNR